MESSPKFSKTTQWVEGVCLKFSLKQMPVQVSLGAIAVLFASLTTWLWPDLRDSSFYEPYLPHAFCFLWNKHLIALHVVSDGLIGLSYLGISIMLTLIAYENRRLMPFRWVFLAFGAFIIACGLTHWMEILVLWRPFYWLEGEAKLVTAAVSLCTACLLPPLAPRIKKLLQDAEKAVESRERMEQAYALTRSIIESSSFSIFVTDVAGTITAVNPAAERLLWFTPTELLHKQNILALYDPQEVAAKAELRSSEFSEPVPSGLDTLTIKVRRGVIDEGEWTFIRKDEAQIPVHVTVTSIRGVAGEDGYMFTAFDITERLRSQEYIRHIATHDSLTGLPSRILFRDRLEVALARVQRFGEQVAVLMIDLDNFKRINDTLGHHSGDEALIVIAERLRGCIRKTDTVARMGGDEFVVILCDVQEKTVDEIATKVLETVGAAISLGSHEVYITASIGVCADFIDNEPISLLKHADLALYKSKAEGKNQINRYTADMAHATVERLQMETALRVAVQTMGFHLQFQPQINLVTGEFTGSEALLRWPRADGTQTLPAYFIPLAEESGLIVPIGEWVVKCACEEGVRLNKKLGREVSIAVNMSPRQFRDRGVFHMIRNALEQSQLPPRCLELEITETMLMHSAKETLDALVRIRELGVRIAIDDFGTGFSSMSYITRFAIDRIKIDQSFVRGVLDDPNSRAVITAIVAMAHGLGITVVAEGTETRAEADQLRQMECDEAQGYYYSRPVNPDLLEALANRNYIDDPNESHPS
jgi:diguanylate cyclase (GGDEF)-like protein/PAS domain S-box-containing protein